jgi:hypothetical protein
MANDRNRMDDLDALPPRERDDEMNEERGRGAGDDLRGVADEGDEEFEDADEADEEEDIDDAM